MKQINELFSPSELSKDHRAIKTQSNIKPRAYKKKKYEPYTAIEKKIYNPDEYRFRLLIFFNNRNEEPGYKGTWIKSIDKYKGVNGTYIDEYEGLMKLERRVKHQYKGLYSRAIIYIGINNDYSYPISHYFKDNELFTIKNKALCKLSFKVIGKNNLVNLENENFLNDVNRFKRRK